MKKLLTLSIAIAALAAWSVRAEDAKTIYEKDCAKCHGQDGKGFGGAHHQQGITLPDGSDREVLQQ